MATNTREKGAKRAETRDKRPQAHVKHVRISPRKVKIVLDLIRNQDTEKAQAILNNAGNKNNEEKLELMKKYYSEFYKLTDEEKQIDTNNIEKIINTIFKNTGIGGVPAAFSYTNKELEEIK